MMRKAFFAIAVALTVTGGVATSHAQQDGSGLTAGVSAEDRTFYANAARVASVNAPVDADAPWTLNGRGGVARFGAADANQCRSFFLRQMTPEVRAAVLGKLCVGPTRPSISGGVPSPNLIVSDIRAASAAGPGGEAVSRPRTGAVRGITIPAPPPPPPAPPPSPEPMPPPPPPPASTGAGQPRSTQVTIKPVMVQINRQTARINQNGGHAIVLLRDTPAVRARNLATCEAMLRHFDDAPISEVRVGIRREADGSISALRPIYWPINEQVTVVGNRCAQRLQRYDFTRSTTIRDKLRITGDGPYLVVSRSDERLATTIDLSGMSNADIEKAAVFFRDGMSQRGDVWDPQSFTRQRQEQSLIASFGVNFPRVLLAAVRFYAPVSSATAGQTRPPCLGDLTDTRRC